MATIATIIMKTIVGTLSNTIANRLSGGTGVGVGIALKAMAPFNSFLPQLAYISFALMLFKV
jgi:hypothetical protein